jgi:hypothetical protein
MLTLILRRTAPIITCLIVVHLAVTSRAQQISVSEAETRIQNHIATIQQRQKIMDDIYLGRDKCDKALNEAAQKATAGDHTDHSTNAMLNDIFLEYNWAGLGGSAGVQDYYTYHTDALSTSLDLIKKQGFAYASDMEYLDKGMSQWAQYEPKVEKAYSDYVTFLATHSVEMPRSSSSLPMDGLPTGLMKTWFEAIKPRDSEPEQPLVTRTPPTSGSSPSAAQPQKGTWLTPTQMKDRPQDLDGLWTAGGSGPAPLQLIQSNGQVLKIYARLSPDPGSALVDLARLGNSNRWSGSGAPPLQKNGTGFSTCPVPRGTCMQLCKWSSGYLDIVPGSLKITGAWNDNHVDPAACQFTTELQTGPEEYDRFVGVSFAPLSPGKYIYMGMAPAVGSDSAQFKALVRLMTNYANTGAAKVTASVGPTTATLAPTSSPGLTATYEFIARAHGNYELTFKLIGKDGSVFHTDRVRIEIPSVPGIGN